MNKLKCISVLIVVTFIFSCSSDKFGTGAVSSDSKVSGDEVGIIRDDGSQNSFFVKKDFVSSDLETEELNLIGHYTDTQGEKGSAVDETQSVQNRPLDILLIVDDSSSMTQSHKTLATKLEDLLTQVKNTDWRIAVITTDPLYGARTSGNNREKLKAACLVSLIKKDDPNYQTTFNNLFTAPAEGEINPEYIGLNGNGHEQAILKAVYGLSQDIVCPDADYDESEESKDWLRPNAALAIIIVSDEDNCSQVEYGINGVTQYIGKCFESTRNSEVYKAYSERVPGLKAYGEQLDKLKEYKELNYSIPTQEDLEDWTKNASTDEEAQKKLNLVINTIRDNSVNFLVDYINNVKKRTFGQDVKVFGLLHSAEGRSRTYRKLIDLSGGKSGKVEKNGSDYSKTFQAISSSLISIVNRFSLTKNPKNKTLDTDFKVYLDGSLLKSGYSITDNKWVSFDERIIKENNQKVKFEYFVGSKRKSQFNLGNNAISGSILVKVDGSQYGEGKPCAIDNDQCKYTNSNHRIRFDKVLDEGSTIDAKYLLKLSDKVVDNPERLDIYVDNKLVASIDKKVDLNSIKINKTEELGILDKDARTLKFNMDEVLKMDNLELSYNFVKERYKTFTIEEVNPKFIYNWTVLVDGEPANQNDYKIKDGNTVEFNDFLPMNSKVTIQAVRENSI